jgi:cytochrome c5
MENHEEQRCHMMAGGTVSSPASWTIAVLALLCVGCSARRSEPIAGPFPIDLQQIAEGRKLFMVHCHQCHPGGEAGLGPAINNKPVPSFMIRLQVRKGFGAMPAFSEQEVSPEELEALLSYLEALRKHG